MIVISRVAIPLGQSDEVMTTSAPAPLQASAMRLSSVATTTASKLLAFFACSQVRTTMGFPRMSTKGFPGNLWDSYLAGITPSCTIAQLVGVNLLDNGPVRSTYYFHVIPLCFFQKYTPITRFDVAVLPSRSIGAVVDCFSRVWRALELLLSYNVTQGKNKSLSVRRDDWVCLLLFLYSLPSREAHHSSPRSLLCLLGERMACESCGSSSSYC